jgi:hypothetical protein
MSSRFIHQKVGAIASTIFIISSGSWVFKTIGTASTQANSLKSIAFHSITGSQANHQIFQSPKTALQSETTATELFFQV